MWRPSIAFHFHDQLLRLSIVSFLTGLKSCTSIYNYLYANNKTLYFMVEMILFIYISAYDQHHS